MAKLPWKPWHEVVKLRDDLKSRDLSLQMFAADLYEVLMQRGKQPVYEKPESFFTLTFPTHNLHERPGRVPPACYCRAQRNSGNKRTDRQGGCIGSRSPPEELCISSRSDGGAFTPSESPCRIIAENDCMTPSPPFARSGCSPSMRWCCCRTTSWPCPQRTAIFRCVGGASNRIHRELPGCRRTEGASQPKSIGRRPPYEMKVNPRKAGLGA
jgi:hypothetical protein